MPTQACRPGCCQPKPRPTFGQSSPRIRVLLGINNDRTRKSHYCEKGYISQPIPTATSKKARNAHRVYFRRSVELCLERNAKVNETTIAKNKSAPKWVRLLKKVFILVHLLYRYRKLRVRSGN